MRELWVEKFRPQRVEDYVFRDGKQKRQVQQWIDGRAIPHLLFSGDAGIGKTTLAKLIFRELEVPNVDILEINASDETGVDNIREKVGRFVKTSPFSDFRYVLLDEADYLSPSSQAALRGLMEQYSTTSRFILTCNFPHKIIVPIQSRCQGFHLTKLDPVEFIARAATILIAEEIEFDYEVLDTFVRATHPDMRKCINMLQQNSQFNKLNVPEKEDQSSGPDYRLKMVELFKSGQINEARKLICEQARPEEYEDIFKFLYQNIEFWGNEQKQEEAILVIRDGLYKHSFVADGELNVAATIIQLAQLRNS